MKKNSEIVKTFVEKMIEVGSEITSKNYMLIMLSSALEEQKKKFPSLSYIDVKDNISVDSKIDLIGKNQVIDPINKVFEYLFLETSKKMMKTHLDDNTYNELKGFGFNI